VFSRSSGTSLFRRLIGDGWQKPRYRGEYILYWGFVHIAFGFLLTFHAPITESTRFIHLALPPPWWGTYSFVGGIWSIFIAFRRNASTLVPFVLLGTLLAARTAGHVIALGFLKDLRQVPNIIVWGALVRIHLTVARWPNPQPVRLDPVMMTEALTAVLTEHIMEKDEKGEEVDQEVLDRMVDLAREEVQDEGD
jgi:hypothetical protein